MAVKTITLYYGVCDRCGVEDEDSRPTAEEAEQRFLPGPEDTILCYDCVDQDGD